MVSLTQSSARTAIEVAEAAEIARAARGNDPNVLAREDLQALLGESALVLDGLRRRPRYFDGRFLTGADLTRDQDYIRQRQADLARAGGTGVVAGLGVALGSDPAGQTLVIAAGHGITPSGDLVMVASSRAIVALDLPASERLDVTLGLSRDPRVPLGRRTGLFVLALRPVEFTANPISAYPTSITGQRRIEDGDVIEATAITLIPWTDIGGAATLADARRAVARAVFTGQPHGLPQDALPLAMIAMERGSIRWIDTALVRRETGADTPLQVSMGARPRALAEAFVLQHRTHLRDVLRDRAAGGLPAAFAAAQYFAALPAAGQLPAASILSDPLGFRQLWFPPACDVELSFAPSDEIAALVEDSLTLPPIDLLGDPEDLDATGIVVMVPVTRQRLQRFEASLAALSRATVPDPAQGIRRAPANMLAAMLARRAKLTAATVRDAQGTADIEAADAQTRAWQAAWNEAVSAIPGREGTTPLVWYFRRRAVADRSNVVGVAVAVGGDDETVLNAIDARAKTLGLTDRLAKLNDAATPFASARIAAFLGSARILNSDMLLSSAIHDLEAAVPNTAPAPRPEPTPERAVPPSPRTLPIGGTALTAATRVGAARISISRIARLPGTGVNAPATSRLSEADVVDVASDYGAPRLGDGIERIEARMSSRFGRAAKQWVGDSGLALELDRAGRDIPAAELGDFAKAVAKAVKDTDAAELARLVGAEV